MYVSHLALTDFRSYEDVTVELSPGVTALVGANGQGKTNLVEALGYLATLGSHRVPGDAALVRSGAARAIVRARVVRDDRPTVLEVEIVPGRTNRARLNRAPLPRARDLLGHLRTVLFAPEDLALVKGDPDGRRRFLDELCVLVAPRLAAVHSDYDRVVRQRSALLKSAAGVGHRGRGAETSAGRLGTLDVWDAKLAQAGSQIMAARLALLDALSPHVATAYEELAGGPRAAHLSYRSTVNDAGAPAGEPGAAAPAETAPTPSAPDPAATVGPISTLPRGAAELEGLLLEGMARSRPREIDRGVCLVGPHRDDLALGLGELPAKGYASHGESWSLALALRLASYRLLTVDDGPWVGDWGADGEPVLILDDVFAELDAARRSRLAALVADASQVLVTAAVPEDVPPGLTGARLDVAHSRVSRVD